MHAVLSLVLTFFSTACLWLLLQAEFLGIVLVLVYVGAVMILFLFVVMMLDVNMPRRPAKASSRYFPVAIAVAAVMFARDTAADRTPADRRRRRFRRRTRRWSPMRATCIGSRESLFSRFMLPFEVAAVILTVAIVVAVMLTLRRREGTKTQNASRAGAWCAPRDRVRLIKMEAVSKPTERNTEGKSP